MSSNSDGSNMFYCTIKLQHLHLQLILQLLNHLRVIPLGVLFSFGFSLDTLIFSVSVVSCKSDSFS